MQLAELLENQTNVVFGRLLRNKYTCDPSIEDAIATFSKSYRRHLLKREPKEVDNKSDYFKLKLPTLFDKIRCKKNESLKELVKLFKELEVSYRLFENELIGRFVLMNLA